MKFPNYNRYNCTQKLKTSLAFSVCLVTLPLLSAPVVCDTKQNSTYEKRPRVLLIGDSISIGYTPQVKQGLSDIAYVERIDGNAASTMNGLKKINSWLDGKSFDIIHFNWGLHDIAYRNEDSPHKNKLDKFNGKKKVEIEDYKLNLQNLVDRLKKTGALLIWASTTAVPDDEPGRFPKDVVAYNSVASIVMQNNGIITNDLYSISKSFDQDMFVAPNNVHFSKLGSSVLANKVTEAIKRHVQ